MFKHTSKKHDCSLNIGSDSMLPKKDDKGGLLHALKKLTLIMANHPNTLKHFISYPAVVAERQRQVIEGGTWIIHPYSMFSLIWCSFIMVIDFIFILLTPMRFCYVLPQEVPVLHPLDHIILTLKIVILFDIFICFNMGYRNKQETYIVLVRRRIALHYLSRWFIVDVLSCIPVGFIVPFAKPGYKLMMFMRLSPCVRCIKLFVILRDFKTFVRIFKVDFICRRLVRLGMLFAISLHWCSCIVYLAPVINFYWTGKPPVGYCRFLTQANGDITKVALALRYKKASFIACSAFFGTAFTTFRATTPDEMVTNAIVIVYGQLFMLYTVAILFKIYVTKYNTIMCYQGLMNQLEKYMRHKQFPTQMRNRVRLFYRYRYQQRYFREALAMDCLSEQLRNEISLDICHKLIQKVSLFEGLPANVVGTVMGCLHAEVYMPNDLVARAGDIGDCMYFIACGTVAVYSLKGAEVCHLDDGAHFGEVALLMKDRKRVATVIAIEITEMYRLDQADFRDFIMTYQELYERIEALASKRMHEIVLIDEPFKQERNTI